MEFHFNFDKPTISENVGAFLFQKGASYINNAGLPDGIALWQGCQIIWIDVHVNTCATI